MNYDIKDVHISTIKNGNAIIHEGVMRTINTHNIKHDKCMGITIWGDSYHLGYKPVKKVIFHGATNTLR